MFGHRFFGARYFGPSYWGDGGLGGVVVNEYLYYYHKRRSRSLGAAYKRRTGRRC